MIQRKKIAWSRIYISETKLKVTTIKNSQYALWRRVLPKRCHNEGNILIDIVFRNQLQFMSPIKTSIIFCIGVGPGTNDFYLLQRAKFTRGFFLLRCYPIRNSFFKPHVNQARSRAQVET